MIKAGEVEKYIPALGWRGLNRYYDAFNRRFMPLDELHQAVLERLRPSAGWRILDLGCGTGTLTLRLARENPGVSVAGIDGDPDILTLAEEKRREESLPAVFRVAMAQELPFGKATFDAAVSTFLFHHLGPLGKRSALAELDRILKPGGRLIILDIGPPKGRLAAAITFFVGFLEETAENVRGRIPELMREAGFVDVRQSYCRNIPFGTARLYEGIKKPMC